MFPTLPLAGILSVVLIRTLWRYLTSPTRYLPGPSRGHHLLVGAYNELWAYKASSVSSSLPLIRITSTHRYAQDGPTICMDRWFERYGSVLKFPATLGVSSLRAVLCTAMVDGR